MKKIFANKGKYHRRCNIGGWECSKDPHVHRTQTQWRGLWCLEMKPIQSLVSQVSGQTATQDHSLELREPLSSDTIENRPNTLSKKVFLEWNFCIRTHLAAKTNLVIDTTTLWAVWLGH